MIRGVRADYPLQPAWSGTGGDCPRHYAHYAVQTSRIPG